MIDEVLGMLITLALLPLSLAGIVARFPVLSRARCHQAVSRGASNISTAGSGSWPTMRWRDSTRTSRCALCAVDGAGMADGLTALAAIIAVGSELLTPHKTDTNSLYITEVLNDLGIAVAFKAIVGDNRAELTAHVAHALVAASRADSHRRPRPDRRRSHARSRRRRISACRCDEDPAIVDAMERRFAARGWKMPAVNRRQAHGAARRDRARQSARHRAGPLDRARRSR